MTVYRGEPLEVVVSAWLDSLIEAEETAETLGPRARLLAITLSTEAPDWVERTSRQIATEIFVTPSQVRGTADRLERAGYIETIRHRGRPTRYLLRLPNGDGSSRGLHPWDECDRCGTYQPDPPAHILYLGHGNVGKHRGICDGCLTDHERADIEGMGDSLLAPFIPTRVVEAS